jgi:hypothetical protein
MWVSSELLWKCKEAIVSLTIAQFCWRNWKGPENLQRSRPVGEDWKCELTRKRSRNANQKLRYKFMMGTAVAQWLRCYATNRKVAGLIPAGVMEFSLTKFFRSHYGPGVDSASNRNEFREYFLGVKSGRCVRLTTYHHPVPLSRNLGTLTSWNPLGLSRPITGLLYLCLYRFMMDNVFVI